MLPEPCWTDVVGSNCNVQRVIPWPPAGIPGRCTSRISGQGWGRESPKCPAADRSGPGRGVHPGRLGRHTFIPRPQLTFPAPRSLPCTSLRPPPPQPPPAPSSSSSSSTGLTSLLLSSPPHHQSCPISTYRCRQRPAGGQQHRERHSSGRGAAPCSWQR